MYHFWDYHIGLGCFTSCGGSQIQYMDMAEGLMEKMDGFPSLIYP
jgi:hypothetical protein